MSASMGVIAGPWIAPQDPMLRANLQVLAEQGLVKGAVNTFPLRWAEFEADLNTIDKRQLDASAALAYRYVKHVYDNARQGQFSTQFKSHYASVATSSQGFASTERGLWSTAVSSETMSDNLAYKIGVGYLKDHQGDKKVVIDGSYFAYAIKGWQFKLSAEEAWWGNGWANSATISQNSRPLPTAGVRYQVNPNYTHLGFEANIAQLDNQEDSYLATARMNGRISFIEYAASYLYLSEVAKHHRDSDQKYQDAVSVDLKAYMPAVYGITGALYGNVTSIERSDGRESRLAGADAQFMLFDAAIRVFAERYKSDGDPFEIIHDGLLVNDQQSNYAAGAFIMLPWDHQLRLRASHYDSTEERNAIREGSAQYLLPAFSGMLNIEAFKEAQGKSEWGAKMSWDYRF